MKYIHKYINEGSDRITLQLEMNTDAIQWNVKGRYIGHTEAVWHLFEYDTHEESPTVIYLAIHLPGEETVYFAEGVDADTLRIQMEGTRIALMAFFSYNMGNEDGHKYLHQQFPTYSTCNLKQRTWYKWKKGTAIGHIYHYNAFIGEKYYLCLGLTTVQGPQSFKH